MNANAIDIECKLYVYNKMHVICNSLCLIYDDDEKYVAF